MALAPTLFYVRGFWMFVDFLIYCPALVPKQTADTHSGQLALDDRDI